MPVHTTRPRQKNSTGHQMAIPEGRKTVRQCARELVAEHVILPRALHRSAQVPRFQIGSFARLRGIWYALRIGSISCAATSIHSHRMEMVARRCYDRALTTSSEVFHSAIIARSIHAPSLFHRRLPSIGVNGNCTVPMPVQVPVHRYQG